MAHRSFPLVFGIFGLLGIFTMGCEAKPRVDTRTASTTSHEAIGAATPAGPIGERLLDTTPAAATRAAVVAAPVPAPVTTSRLTKPTERLPSWVPVTGRLSVVETPDLAENLGLVPKGTTKKTEGRISVADLLDKNAAVAVQPLSAPQPTSASVTSATWLAANGRIRHGRSGRR